MKILLKPLLPHLASPSSSSGRTGCARRWRRASFGLQRGSCCSSAGAAASRSAARAARSCFAFIFALSRPPGHHAGADFFGGYCFLNNAALAAQHLRNAGMKKVAVLDVEEARHYWWVQWEGLGGGRQAHQPADATRRWWAFQGGDSGGAAALPPSTACPTHPAAAGLDGEALPLAGNLGHAAGGRRCCPHTVQGPLERYCR